jgi:hypothetical protein
MIVVQGSQVIRDSSQYWWLNDSQEPEYRKPLEGSPVYWKKIKIAL